MLQDQPKMPQGGSRFRPTLMTAMSLLLYSTLVTRYSLYVQLRTETEACSNTKVTTECRVMIALSIWYELEPPAPCQTLRLI